MSFVQRVDRAVFGTVSVVAQALLWVAVATGFFQVVSRFVLHSPLDWSEVLTRAVIIWAVLLGVALAFRQGAMISVDFLRQRLRGNPRRILETIIHLVCLAFMVFLAWIGGQMTYRVRFQTVAGLDVSISWIYLAIPVGAGLAALAILLHWFIPDAASEEDSDRPPANADAQG